MAKREINKKTAELNITVAADKAVWKAEQEKAFKELAKNVEIKGFRKGQVPADLARKNISQTSIFEKAIAKALDILVKEAAKEIKEDEMILDSPTYKVEKISDAELEVTFIYPMYPEFKIADYKNLDVKYVEPKLADDLVETELKKIQEQQALLKTKEGAIANGDIAVFDFDGYTDGKPFDGGKAENYELEIGSGQFIPGFEEQMVGMKAGDAKDVNVKFPAEYHSDALKGKDATFKVKIHEVKAKDLPELTDEFVKASDIPNVTTVAELKAYIKEVFTEQEKQNARATFQREAFAKIKETTEVPVPASLIAKEMHRLGHDFAEQIKKQGISMDQYMQMTGLDQVKMDAQFRVQAENSLKDSLIFAEIAKLEKIELSDEDYDKEYVKLAKVYGQSPEGIKGMITKAQMQIPMTNDRVIDVLIAASK